MQNHNSAPIIKELTPEEMLSVYTTHSVRHFPKAERKPADSIRRMAEEGIYKGYGLYASLESAAEALLCYAFFTVPKETGAVLLDYFAVMEEYRSHGVGSLFLRHIKTSFRFDGILIEVENPDFAADDAERGMQEKRISFYRKNGTLDTGIRARIFQVPYQVLFFPIRRTPPARALYDDFVSIYRHMVTPENYRTQVDIRLPGDLPCK